MEQRNIVWSVREIAESQNVCPHAVTKWIRNGLLPATKKGLGWIVTHADMVAFLATPRRGAGRPPKPHGAPKCHYRKRATTVP